jgi:ParB/RepB/Spo0J family partition protein
MSFQSNLNTIKTVMSTETIVRVPLGQIEISSTNPRKDINKDDLQELVESVIANGVIQAIKLRPKKDSKKYEIVFGERRYRASHIAGIEDIPAMIVEMSDEEVEKEQFIENMVRADVHPMDEALKFNEMINRKGSVYDSAGIAKLINKSLTYVLQRIELLMLIPDLQKDFWKGMFGFDMAQQFARLHVKVQKEAMRMMKNSDTGYSSPGRLKEWVERNVTKSLKNAPWDKKDPAVFPKAGACITCPKRSGANLLFADIKDKDTCFDGVCFNIKQNNYTMAMIDHVMEKHPDIQFMKHGYETVDPAIVKKIDAVGGTWAHGLNSWKGDSKDAVKVFFVNGSDMGKIETWYKPASSKPKKADVSALAKDPKAKPEKIIEAVDNNIAGIEERQKRFLELDDEKVWAQIQTEVIAKQKDVLFNEEPLNDVEWAALLKAMESKLGYGESDTFSKAINVKDPAYKLNPQTSVKYVQEMVAVPMTTVYKLMRIFIKECLNKSFSHTRNAENALLYAVVSGYLPAEVKAIEDAQAEVAAKRIARAKENIDKLKKQKVDVSAKIIKKKPAAEKAAKKK